RSRQGGGGGNRARAAARAPRGPGLPGYRTSAAATCGPVPDKSWADCRASCARPARRKYKGAPQPGRELPDTTTVRSDYGAPLGKPVGEPYSGTDPKRLWLLRSRPDQVRRRTMRRGPPTRILTERARRRWRPGPRRATGRPPAAGALDIDPQAGARKVQRGAGRALV